MMLSTKVADGLRDAGHDAVHARQYGLQRALDAEILARATAERRILISEDMDFRHLACGRAALVGIRGAAAPPAFHQAEFVVTLLLANLPQLAESLEQGSLVVMEERRIRVRRLPINPA
jgi:predicted nuclease of predicted toxin-antitoxin system